MEKKKFPGKVTPYLFILPWIIGFIVFTAGPLILSLVMSFFDWPITSTPTFRGLGNYVEMFTKDKQFYKSLVITLKYAAIFVPLNMIIALFLAMLITQPVKGVKIYRTIFYIPAVVSGVAISIIWGWILNGNYGVLNYLLSLLGIEGPNWLVDPSWALLAVILASAFGVGTMMLIFYTDIKSIPIDLYEAASLDGASPFYLYKAICMPLSKPIISLIALQTFIGNWNDFFWAWLVTEDQKLWTLNVALYNISNNSGTKQNALMGLAVVTITPVILLSILFSKQLKQSIMASGVKG